VHSDGAPAPHSEILKILPGLLLAMLLAMLDSTIVGSALPRMVSDLGGLSHLSWAITAYVLASTVSTPLYGKLGDLYGRRGLFLSAIVIFLAGSLLTGAAQTMDQLIAFRAVQGVGAGGLIVGVLAIIGELVPPRERGRYQGYTGSVLGIALIGGPVVGGLITDHLSWRWAFWINLPLGFVVLGLVLATLRLPPRRRSARVDVPGFLLLTACSVSVVLLITWGGTRYRWTSLPIIALAAVGVLSLALLIPTERRAREPLLPPRLFTTRNLTLSVVMAALLGFMMYAALTFLPLYQQTVQHASATNSGLLLLPMLASMLVTAILVGQAITRTGRFKAYPVAGGLLMATGLAALGTIGTHTSHGALVLYMAIVGLGMGCLTQVLILIAQNSVELRDIGVASSTEALFQNLGGSIGVSAMGAVFTHRLGTDLGRVLPAGVAGQLARSGTRIGPDSLGGLPAGIRQAYFAAVADASHLIFIVAVPFALAVFVAALAVRAVPLRGMPGAPPAGDLSSPQPAAQPAAQSASVPGER
jgi:EmrB/QacA subfamily drug resistance transporter